MPVAGSAAMHYFTKQMIQGGPRYGGGVRVGNWNEDKEMGETLEKNFLYMKETGSLKLDGCVELRGMKSQRLTRAGRARVTAASSC